MGSMSWIEGSKPQIDETGNYFFWKRFEDTSKKAERVYPENLGYAKKLEQKVYIRKKINSEDSLEDAIVWFEMVLTYQIPEGKQYRHLWLYKVKSGKVFLKSFEFGHCLQASWNDSEIVTRGKAKKCAPDTILPANAMVFEVDPKNNELRLDVSI